MSYFKNSKLPDARLHLAGVPFRIKNREEKFWKEIPVDLPSLVWGVSDKKIEKVIKPLILKQEGGSKIIYQRITETKKSTTGEFKIPGTSIKGYFLEPAGPSTTKSGTDRRVPGGVYHVVHHKGKKFKDALRIYNSEVPQSRAILIHPGNNPGNTEGCFLPGSTVSKDFVGASRVMFSKIRKHFKKIGFVGATMVIKEAGKKESV